MPWFGGKSKVAHLIWQAFGNVPNYVEPFFGSGAVLLKRPHEPGIETINDKDGFVANAWRAIQSDPDAVAHYADWPVNECDLHARHIYLVHHRDELTERLMGDHQYYDPIIAGYWIWGICCWIGGEFCSGKGPWHSVDGKLTRSGDVDGRGVKRRLVHLGNAGQGVHRQGVKRKRVHLGNAGQGIHRQGVERRRVHLGDAGQGIHRVGMNGNGIYDWMHALAERLRSVRVCCGDWTRILGPSPTCHNGLTGVFLDPPYSRTERDRDIYNVEADISDAVRVWAIANGDNPQMRIALCGYEGEHEMPGSWRCTEWQAHGGYAHTGNGKGKDNAGRERVWFSPHCLDEFGENGNQLSFFRQA